MPVSRSASIASAALFVCAALSPGFAQEQQFADLGDLKLSSGETLRHCRLGYRTLGSLNAAKSNAVLFPTWFRGGSENLLALVGPGKLVDSARFYVILVDALGNGVSSSPSNSRPPQSRARFPQIGIRDMVNAEHELAVRTLGLSHLHAVMGISMGGMQTFEWMVAYPDFFDYAVPIVGTPWQSSYDLLLWKTTGRAIRLDPAWKKGNYRKPPEEALRTAAGITGLAIETPEAVVRRAPAANYAAYAAEREKSALASDANDYLRQLDAMIAHDIRSRFGGDFARAAAAVRAHALVVVGVRDHMVNPQAALEFARAIKADTLELASDCGHLVTSCEAEAVGAAVRRFLNRTP
jgi:homoserine O-acetyltransferase/O-succinyltransferase